MKKLRLVADWKKVWKYYSTWALAVLGAMPDLYNLLSYSDYLYYMPETLAWSIRGVALVGLLGRFIDQNKPGKEP